MNMMEAPELLWPESSRRHDIYKVIHKALRARMCRVLVRVGALDVQDPDELRAGLDELDALLSACASHLQHENDFVHAAMEAAQPASSADAATEHVQHRQAIAALQAASRVLRQRPQADSALRLYRQLSLFVADNLLHMQHEETAHNAVLWQHCTDADIQGLEQRLQASIAPAEMEDTLRWMVTGMNPAERAELFGALQAQLPAEPFLHLLYQARERLDDRAWGKLAHALGLPPVPGLMTA